MPRRNPPPPKDPDQGLSKTQLKAEMQELQALATALLDLPDPQLDEIEMADNLREALRELRKLKTYEARRRQAQYVGKLVRDADPQPMREAIEAYRMSRTRAANALHEVEQWRERLLADDQAVTAWFEAHPATDTQRLRSLIREARREVAATLAVNPYAATDARKGKAYRELFKSLRDALA